MLKRNVGFTLIELLVSLAIFSLLLALAVPTYAEWVRNVRIRTMAESVQNGLQLAKVEAVRRNTTVRFQLTDKTDDNCVVNTVGPNWVVSLDDAAGKCGRAPSETLAPRIVRVRSGEEGTVRSGDGTGRNTVLTSDNGVLVFNGMGRLVTPAAVNIDVTDATASTARSLRIAVSAGGQIRMCDPALTLTKPTDAQAC